MFGVKNPFEFSLKSRTNLIALATVLGGVFKMFWPEYANYGGDPLLLITGGMGLIYLREGKNAE